MQFKAIFALLAASATVVGALPAETNADRMARGLPPLPPSRRATPVGAKRTTPSSTPTTCNTGPIQCCNSLTTAGSFAAGLIISLLGLHVNSNTLVGLTCQPRLLTCAAATLCCTDNNHNGLISIGCVAVNA